MGTDRNFRAQLLVGRRLFILSFFSNGTIEKEKEIGHCVTGTEKNSDMACKKYKIFRSYIHRNNG